jgi:hypothetical protein
MVRLITIKRQEIYLPLFLTWLIFTAAVNANKNLELRMRNWENFIVY